MAGRPGSSVDAGSFAVYRQVCQRRPRVCTKHPLSRVFRVCKPSGGHQSYVPSLHRL